MKRILLTTALVAATSSMALAANDNLEASVEDILDGYAFSADVSELSDETISEIYAIWNAEDSPADKRASIKLMLEEAGQLTENEEMTAADSTTSVEMPMNEMRSKIEPELATMGFDVDVENLSEDEVNAIYLAIFSGDAAEQRNEIEAILQ